MVMKINVILVLIVVSGLLSCEKNLKIDFDCLSPSLQDGVIAFYTFSNGSLEDFSSNNNSLMNPTAAGLTTDRNGNENCAYIFNNLLQDGEYLTMEDPEFLNGLSEFSISIWYQPLNSSRPGGMYESLLSRGEGRRCPDRDGEWSVGLYDSRRAVFGHNNSVWVSPISEVENWYHIVVVLESNTYKIYWNGSLEEEKVGNANCTNFQEAQSLGNMFIGNKFTGKIDDVIIYNRVLNENEIIELSTLGACCD